MIINGPIESFFKSPKDDPSFEGDCILYHLRRDLVTLYGTEAESSKNASLHVRLAMMGILAGIDYLSKVYSSLKESPRLKYVETVKDFCNISGDDAEALYQLRCALVHSMALSTISSCSHRNGNQFIFEVTDDESLSLIEKTSDIGSEVTYRVCFMQMKNTFIKIILELEKIARNVEHSKNSYVINMIGQMHSEKILKIK